MITLEFLDSDRLGRIQGQFPSRNTHGSLEVEIGYVKYENDHLDPKCTLILRQGDTRYKVATFVSEASTLEGKIAIPFYVHEKIKYSGSLAFGEREHEILERLQQMYLEGLNGRQITAAQFEKYFHLIFPLPFLS